MLQQAVKRRGSPHYTDLLIEKIHSTASPTGSLLYIQDTDDGIPIMVIEIEKVTPVQLIDIHYKDIMEMLVCCKTAQFYHYMWGNNRHLQLACYAVEAV